MSDTVISLKNISKSYKMYNSPAEKLKEMFHPFKKKYHRDFWSLRDVSFDVKKGESLGIIGRNGSGKSTLLKILCGVLQPTTGEVQVNGRISALLELGAGFNPEFTGRENVFMNGAIMGISQKEMEERFYDIATFADIGDFIDQPVKVYSSGMYVRLAFACAVNVDPDILIVDEALSVGDVKFQAKCFRKFEEFQNKDKTILFVTHSTEQIVRHCDKAVLLNDGQKFSECVPRDIANQYMNLLFGKKPADKSTDTGKQRLEVSVIADSKQYSGKNIEEFIEETCVGEKFNCRKSYNKQEYRWGDRSAEIIDYLIVSGKEVDPSQCESHEEFNLYLKVKFNRAVDRPIYGLTIKTSDGVAVCGSNSRGWENQRSYFAQKAGDVRVVHFSFKPRLAVGEYLLSVGVVEDVEGEIEVPLDRRYDSIHLQFLNTNFTVGLLDLGLKFELVM